MVLGRADWRKSILHPLSMKPTFDSHMDEVVESYHFTLSIACLNQYHAVPRLPQFPQAHYQ